MKVLAIIPARYDSSRFPGKPLVEIGGKSMIQRVYEQAKQASLVDKVIVATDDQRIFEHLQSLGYAVELSGSHHQSGTDRCAEVAQRYREYHIVINVQGDEPFIAPEQIDAVITSLKDTTADISTLAKRIKDVALLSNPNVVKVARSDMGNALYFSRSPIPYVRAASLEDWIAHQNHYQHIGIYGFRRQTLLELTKLPIASLEKAEALEQLRWLEHGYGIAVGLTEIASYGIDTLADLEKVKTTFGF